MRRSFRRAYAVSSPGTALLRCAVGHSSRPSLAVAVQEAVQAATSGLARAPDLLFVYSSARGSAADVYGVVRPGAALLGLQADQLRRVAKERFEDAQPHELDR